ncbi:DUF5906 domain-containing protein [Iodobacter fluviatilis]|uniref:DNA primase n=1 Tax=Iodobacter fluviatilis TaxID=537 RepID=A0A7G3GB98_9NEIS|nr:DUF5906 domain-containing protein [Iodobacter fluviatilis]QBC44448.1 DNA primase [Iodobacter fluviatilis]
MSFPINYDDALGQLQAFGLLVTAIDVGRMKRVKVEGDREKRGWYMVHEILRDDGQTMIVGSFGMWRGNENNAQKIALGKDVSFSADQLAAIKAAAKVAQERVDFERKQMADRAAKEAAAMWARLNHDGDCTYLARKGVAGHGVRFTAAGNMAIPLLDGGGKIHGLQIIYATKSKKTGRDKDFWPEGMLKKGYFFQIGTISNVVLIAEGYATGASIHQATGLPVVIAFDAGNLLPVSQAIQAKYKKAKVLICGDDDYVQKCVVKSCKKYNLVTATHCCACGAETKAKNAGALAADAAALAVSGAWIAPVFANERPSDKKGPTDFNDLHALEGLHVVRTQIENRLTVLGWVGNAVQPLARAQGGGEVSKLVIGDAEELFTRFSLVYGAGGVCFDHEHHMLLKLSDVRDACADKNFVRDWQAGIHRRKVVRMEQVGFDPTGLDTTILCNMWAGWPTKPAAGECFELLELLYYLCSGEPDADAIYGWLLKWLAYPIQHPGAKMKSACVIHGPQGTGKNLFFDCIRDIYGEYGQTIDQTALEDKHNDWSSKKLFLIADEVVAQQEMHHIKNKLKCMVTGDTIRVNPKHVAAHKEKNHVNLVFLSNEHKPIVLERDDRRNLILYTPPKLDKINYIAINAEIKAGGVAALHNYLLKVDLTGFHPDSEPPMTVAKRDLINVSMDGWEEFAMSWSEGLLAHLGVLPLPCDCEILYQSYRRWSEKSGQRFIDRKNDFTGKVSKLNGFAKRERVHVTIGHCKRQVTMLYPFGKTEIPVGETATSWNSSCIEKVTNALEIARKGAVHEYA